MWNLTLPGIGNGTNGTWLTIAGCPDRGITAVDYRRGYGLPDGDTNRIYVPTPMVQSESVVRRLAGFLGVDATDSWDMSGVLRRWICALSRGRFAAEPRNSVDVDVVPLRPETVRRYLEAVEARTAASLDATQAAEDGALAAAIEEIWRETEAFVGQSRVSAENEAAGENEAADIEAALTKQREGELAAARELLADELRDRDQCIADLEARLAAMEDAAGDGDADVDG